jgi:hypothetical protein
MEYVYFNRDAENSRASFAVSHPGQLYVAGENVLWLDKTYLDTLQPATPLTARQLTALAQGELRAINQAHPRWPELREPIPSWPSPARLNLLACGDVGSTVLLGLKLLARELIGDIGIYDRNAVAAQRWEFELSQIAGPDAAATALQISIIDREQLFDCDIFVFCASAGVPPLEVKDDVRLLQYEKNAAIIAEYARAARAARFRGLFCVVSDPVDLLCRVALRESNRNDSGSWDGCGLFPEQIEGFGLGVMHGRAAYFARQDQRFTSYLTQGRAFGPHGQGLVLANSLANYDDALSRELTELAVRANLTARELGFKPYVAPAMASAVLPLLASLRGEWHYSCTSLGEVFMGARNRRQPAGLEVEVLPLPAQLRDRIEETAAYLASLDNYC